MRFRPMGLALAISIIPIAANAQLTIEMANIRCDQYLAMPPAQSRDFSSWMSGWFMDRVRRRVASRRAASATGRAEIAGP